MSGSGHWKVTYEAQDRRIFAGLDVRVNGESVTLTNVVDPGEREMFPGTYLVLRYVSDPILGMQPLPDADDWIVFVLHFDGKPDVELIGEYVPDEDEEVIA